MSLRRLHALLVCVCCIGCAMAEAQTDNPVVRAIALLQKGEGSAAYRSLVQAFRMSRSLEERAKIALLLALSDERAGKIPRSFYADYALQNYSNLGAALAIRLTGVVGDAKLEARDFPAAKRAYQFILASPDTRQVDREAATYRLGKVYWAEGSPARAFRLWQNWLEQSEDGILHDAIVRDSGVAFALALGSGDAVVLRLPLRRKEDQKSFIEGILSEVSGDRNLKRIVPRILLATKNKTISEELKLAFNDPTRARKRAEQKSGVFQSRKIAAESNIDSLLIDFAKMELLNYEEKLLEPKRPEAKASSSNTRL